MYLSILLLIEYELFPALSIQTLVLKQFLEIHLHFSQAWVFWGICPLQNCWFKSLVLVLIRLSCFLIQEVMFSPVEWNLHQYLVVSKPYILFPNLGRGKNGNMFCFLIYRFLVLRHFHISVGHLSWQGIWSCPNCPLRHLAHDSIFLRYSSCKPKLRISIMGYSNSGMFSKHGRFAQNPMFALDRLYIFPVCWSVFLLSVFLLNCLSFSYWLISFRVLQQLYMWPISFILWLPFAVFSSFFSWAKVLRISLLTLP